MCKILLHTLTKTQKLTIIFSKNESDAIFIYKYKYTDLIKMLTQNEKLRNNLVELINKGYDRLDTIEDKDMKELLQAVLALSESTLTIHDNVVMLNKLNFKKSQLILF